MLTYIFFFIKTMNNYKKYKKSKNYVGKIEMVTG
jgi:hypothetical protein